MTNEPMQARGPDLEISASGVRWVASRSAAEDAAVVWLLEKLERARGEVFAEIVPQVTPAMATVLLEINHSNRPIVKSALQRWQSALRDGRWRLNGETIKVTKEGKLGDGQHRLTAVVTTGIAAPFVIVWGVTKESVASIDIGMKRNAGHVAAMSGIPQATHKAAAMRIILNYDQEVSLATSREPDEVRDAILAAPTLVDSLAPGKHLASFYKQPTGLFTALHFLACRYDHRLADDFFEGLANGGYDHPDHPIKKMRARLQEQITAKGRLRPVDIAALMIRAFNAFVLGRNLRQLQWKNGPELAEEFPRFLPPPVVTPRSRRDR